MKRYPNTINILDLVAELENRDDQQKTINARLTSELIAIRKRLNELEKKDRHERRI